MTNIYHTGHIRTQLRDWMKFEVWYQKLHEPHQPSSPRRSFCLSEFSSLQSDQIISDAKGLFFSFFFLRLVLQKCSTFDDDFIDMTQTWPNFTSLPSPRWIHISPSSSSSSSFSLPLWKVGKIDEGIRIGLVYSICVLEVEEEKKKPKNNNTLHRKHRSGDNGSLIPWMTR